MTNLVRRRHRGRYNQPNHPSPLPSPPPTPGGDHQPTSLFRRPDVILLPDGRRISIYEGWHGFLVTDAIRGSTRPVEDVYMEVLYDLQTRSRYPPPPMGHPVRRGLRHLGRDAHQLCILPDNRIIHAYLDRHGVLFTDDMDGSTRRVEDVCREVISDLQTRRRGPPPPMAKPVRRHLLDCDPHKPVLLLCLLPDDRIIHAYNDSYGVLVTKDMDGFTQPVRDVFREVLWDLWTRPRDPPPPAVDAAKEDQPAPQQTATPSPGPFGDDLLNRHCVANKLKQAQRREGREQNVLASKELLGTTTLEESSITNASSLLQPTPCRNDGLSRSEIAIRDALYWPDGTRKHKFRSNTVKDHMGLLVQALLDKYNEENNLLGVCSLSLPHSRDSLASVLRTVRERLDEFELTFLYMVKPAVDNGPCYGCKEDNVGMKHPIDTGKYKGGHNPSWPPCCGVSPPEDMDAIIKGWDERITNEYKKLDVVKSDAGRTAAADGLDKSQLGRRGFLAADDRMNEERIRYITGTGDVAKSYAERTAAGWEGMRDRDVAKSDAGRTDAGFEGMRGKYVVPARRQLV